MKTVGDLRKAINGLDDNMEVVVEGNDEFVAEVGNTYIYGEKSIFLDKDTGNKKPKPVKCLFITGVE